VTLEHAGKVLHRNPLQSVGILDAALESSQQQNPGLTQTVERRPPVMTPSAQIGKEDLPARGGKLRQRRRDLAQCLLDQESRVLALMELASKLGLPIESVNSAADFFVHRISGWREMLVPFRSGTRGAIFRPNATLFLLLKIGPLSENDLADCTAVIQTVQQGQEPLDRPRVLIAMDALALTEDLALQKRRLSLREMLGPE
jgi:hypothetical protein